MTQSQYFIPKHFTGKIKAFQLFKKYLMCIRYKYIEFIYFRFSCNSKKRIILIFLNCLSTNIKLNFKVHVESFRNFKYNLTNYNYLFSPYVYSK